MVTMQQLPFASTQIYLGNSSSASTLMAYILYFFFKSHYGLRNPIVVIWLDWRTSVPEKHSARQDKVREAPL